MVSLDLRVCGSGRPGLLFKCRILFMATPGTARWPVPTPDAVISISLVAGWSALKPPHALLYLSLERPVVIRDAT